MVQNRYEDACEKILKFMGHGVVRFENEYGQLPVPVVFGGKRSVSTGAARKIPLLTDLNEVHKAEMAFRGKPEEFHNDPLIYRRWKDYQYHLISHFGASATADERCLALAMEIDVYEAAVKAKKEASDL